MSRHHSPHRSARPVGGRRTPRALVDPITGEAEALAVIAAAASHPLEHETIAFALDDGRFGSVITVVTNTEDPDCIVSVVEILCAAASADPLLTGMVVASVRPDGATLPGDIDRWLEASEVADSFGIELIEWFVVGPAGAECPRDLIGEPARW
jgi:hypothetical protein